MRRWALVAVMGLIAGCGSRAAPAPEVTATEQVCAVSFCIAAPAGWETEIDADTISFTHPNAAEAIVFVSVVDMAWMLESTGSSWPASLEAVERAYWSLLATPPVAPELVRVTPGGWAESQGRLGGLPRWHAVYPVDAGPVAVAITIELPAATWAGHARTFLDGVTLLGE